MLTVKRKGLLTRDFDLLDGTRVAASFEYGGWSERAEIRIGPEVYEARREGWLSSSFSLEQRGVVRATAESTGFLQRTLEVRCGHKPYEFKREGWLSADMILLDGERQVGSITREGFFRTDISMTFSSDVEPKLQAFLAFIAAALWRQDAAGAS